MIINVYCTDCKITYFLTPIEMLKKKGCPVCKNNNFELGSI